jgi:hypothetical protein
MKSIYLCKIPIENLVLTLSGEDTGYTHSQMSKQNIACEAFIEKMQLYVRHPSTLIRKPSYWARCKAIT